MILGKLLVLFIMEEENVVSSLYTMALGENVGFVYHMDDRNARSSDMH